MASGTSYVLYYWPGIPGRGEYIRLALEYAGKEYEEVNKVDDLMAMLNSDANECLPFALPCLKLPNGLLISQTPNILMVLAKTLGLAGDGSETQLMYVNQIVLTILDLALEAHDSHHPIASSLYYEDQKAEAVRRADDFKKTRMPKFLSYFDRLLKKEVPCLIGQKVTVADLTLFQTLRGLEFAFPKRYGTLIKDYAAVLKFIEYMKSQEGMDRFLRQPKRLQFKDGLFRHYPELDD